MIPKKRVPDMNRERNRFWDKIVLRDNRREVAR
jgi:hypothetical protein